MVLGGLMDEQTRSRSPKGAAARRHPVLGYLFPLTSNTTAKRNLMVFIRPTILRDANVYTGVSSNKYTLFRAEQQNLAARRAMPPRRPARCCPPTPGRDAPRGAEADRIDEGAAAVDHCGETHGSSPRVPTPSWVDKP